MGRTTNTSTRSHIHLCSSRVEDRVYETSRVVVLGHSITSQTRSPMFIFKMKS